MNYRIANYLTKEELEHCTELLARNGLRYEEKVSDTIAIYDQDKIIATGSIYENVIKMIAVDENYQGQNITAIILNHYINYFSNKRVYKYFIYTKPESVKYFTEYNFSLVSMTDTIALLENNFETIDEFLQKQKQIHRINDEDTACIVMNCNPVTNGHLYLIEKCAKENHKTIIFLVEEDKSVFPYSIRYELLTKATSHLSNVQILPSSIYIISSATFPTYFLKELNQASLEYMKLDIQIFKDHFMKIFHIAKRYIGSEPLDPTTSAYNQTMRDILKDQLVVIDRKMFDSHIISASRVRKLAQELKFDELKPYVPEVTYQLLTSEVGRALFL
ncbi:MAG TPA: GNAT family N-acetyltransferase [Bacilli bacterium]|nr:GNAT family N-acetyltransferase [Bacilli bacterium]